MSFIAKKKLEKLWFRKSVIAIFSTSIRLGYLLDDWGILPNQHLIGLRLLIKLGLESLSFKTMPGLVDYHDQDIAGVPCRVYKPHGVEPGTKLPVVVFFHGGGCCVGSAKSYHGFTMSLCKSLQGAIVVSTDYRLAPENPYPAQVDDCLAVTRTLLLADSNRWAVGPLHGMVDSSRIAVAGDSAGGTLSGVAALDLIRLKVQPSLAGVLMISPCMQAVTTTHRSVGDHMDDFPIPAGVAYFLAMYAGCSPTRETCDAINNDKILEPHDYNRLLPYVMPPWLLKDDPSKFYSDAHINKTVIRHSNFPIEITKLATTVRAWPLLAEDSELAQFPPAMVQSFSHDVLQTENLIFFERLKHAGARYVEHSHIEGAEHIETINGRFFGSKSGRIAYKESVEFLRRVLRL